MLLPLELFADVPDFADATYHFERRLFVKVGGARSQRKFRNNAAVNDGRPRRCSMKGAPRKIHRNDGMNVTQVAMVAPNTPACIGLREPGLR